MARAGRIAAFDLLRAAAIFGVVWIHGCDTSAWALRMCRYASVSVPLFILISFFLMQSSAIRHPEEGARALLRKRLVRLLPAYAVWSAVYVVVRLAKRALLPSADLAALDPVSVVWLGGASYQLYFIAALIYWSALFLPLIGLGARHSRRGPAGAVALAAAGAGMLWAGARVFARVEIAPEHSLFAHALLLTGYVPLGMAIALGLARRNLAAPPLRAFSRACAAGGAAALALFGSFPGMPALASVLLVLWAATHGESPMPAGIRRISELSFGIYFVHGFFVEGLQGLAGRLSWPIDRAGGATVLIVAAFAFSWLACEILRRVPWLRWLVA